MDHYFYLYNEDLDERGIVKIPYAHPEALSVFLRIGVKEDINVGCVDVNKPDEKTGHTGSFVEKRLDQFIEWKIKYLGSLPIDSSFGFLSI